MKTARTIRAGAVARAETVRDSRTSRTGTICYRSFFGTGQRCVQPSAKCELRRQTISIATERQADLETARTMFLLRTRPGLVRISPPWRKCALSRTRICAQLATSTTTQAQIDSPSSKASNAKVLGLPSTPAGTSEDNSWRAISTLSKYVWPRTSTPESYHLKQRVVASLGLMIAGKAVTIQIPFVFKALVDTIPDPSGHLPILLLAGYGISRSAASALQEYRNMVFAKVAQNAIRTVGRTTFDHVHSLDLQFHLSRNTGQLARVLDRGQRSISFVLNAMVFHVGPTLLEVSLVTGLVAYQFGLPHASVVLGTVGAYTGFTFLVTSWYGYFACFMASSLSSCSNRLPLVAGERNSVAI